MPDESPPLDSESPLWRVTAYRLALDAIDAAEMDTRGIVADPRFNESAEQLISAVGSISASIAEGYARRSPLDRARYYEYGYGSANEARSWYYGARRLLAPKVIQERANRLTSICRLLTRMIRNERDGDANWNSPRRDERSDPRPRLPPPRDLSPPRDSPPPDPNATA